MLGGLQEVEPLDLENYAEVKQSTFRLPVAGEYTLRAPDSFPTEAFSRTKRTGAIQIQIDPTIAAGEHEGFKLRFTKVSGTVYKRDGKSVSQIGDYLRATGFKGVLKTEQDQADAVEGTANQIYNARINWRVYNSKTGFSLEGMTKFPKLADGTYQSWVEDPGDINAETGKPQRLRANLYIEKFIQKSE